MRRNRHPTRIWVATSPTVDATIVALLRTEQVQPMAQHRNLSMRLRHLIGFPLLLAALSAAAQQPETYRPVTAGELYGGIMEGGLEGGLASWVHDPAQRAALSSFMAMSYILGVANSTQNQQWCPKRPPEVRALSSAVLDYLADLPRKRHTENAAVVVIEALRKASPCP